MDEKADEKGNGREEQIPAPFPPPTSPEEKDATSGDHVFIPPDGGLTAWLQVLAMLLISMVSWGSPSAFGVYQLYYKDTLKISQSQVSWIGSVQFLLTYGMCTVSGRLADAGYIHSTVAVGAFLVVLGTFMTSLGTQYWHFLLSQGLCVGFGLGTMFMPPLAVATSYFDKRRTMAVTCAATGTGIGGVVFPAIIQYLIPKVGFPWAVRVSAFVALVAAGTALLLLRPRLKPRKSGPLVEWSAFREKPYLFFAIGAFMLYWALFFASFYINSFARNILGFSTSDSIQLLLISNGMSVPARPLIGFVANQHFGAMNTYIVVTAIFAGLMLAWIAVHDRVGMYIFTVFFGLANGLCQGMFLGALASLTQNPTKMGSRSGTVHTIVAFATLAGPPTAGAIIDRSGGNYTNAQIWGGLMIFIAAGFFTASRLSKTGAVLRIKI
ncbi:Major facilitator superfamily domain, general substrate transporter [Cordyceps fumosorosea ARSEF 2679]|uniref:Major facilitator superfamily domain, general substrate transporter n=1 Tax=Cordyceps fumosorosea (strain ARSEF 2679) TaxID=1081104 RepID=A0A167V4J8_CORFA|nr:Major facilitator superfamily domain, general substrate transporter [Cordyceps fumosorosea ARSEF 2679]OAA62217.1 Major facilitator superfamily domain, general substrate transporter [Cordyceps fumosorosea ARSEF 2679]